jgi:NAD(P)H-hydrate epimerase
MTTENQIKSDALEINFELLRTMPLPQYDDDAHKATRGKLLVIAGSQRLPGPAILAARAALRAGCGTVRVAAPQSLAMAIGIAVPELMMIPLPEKDGHISQYALPFLQDQIEPCDAVVIGPGLDENPESDDLVSDFLANCPLPAVVDAQALCALGEKPKDKATAPRIFTPHDGEMEKLTGKPFGDDRAKAAKAFAKARGVTLVLKARETFIAAPDGPLYINKAGSRALGTAGSGDTLAGIIGSLLAQGMEATAAAVWGVHLHALVGEALEEDMGADGILAGDFVARLPFVLRYARKQAAPSSSGRRYGLRPAG